RDFHVTGVQTCALPICAWAEGRAKAYGIKIDELPAFYAKRILLNETILPEDIANACFVFVGGLMSKATGNVLNVDGGVSMAFVRSEERRVGKGCASWWS